MALIRDYFKKTDDLRSEYGEKSIVMMQVGSFYEVYGMRSKDGILSGSDISTFSSHCGLSIASKNAILNGKDVVMAGIRDYILDKYVQKMLDIDYTIAVYSQDEKAAGTTRSLTAIYSPGTMMSLDEEEKITNNTMCLWFQKMKSHLIVGVGNIDIYTGKSMLFEYDQEYSATPEAYDNLERYLTTYQPSELIVIHNMDEAVVSNILQFADVRSNCLHLYSIETSSDVIKKRLANCEKQVYQQQVLEEYFNGGETQTISNFNQYVIGTQAYCFLLDFIYRHNPNLTKKIKPPLFENATDRMVLANHSLKQLNIINGETGIQENGRSLRRTRLSRQCTSVLSLLNQCITPMGKRKLQFHLLHPTTDGHELETEYAHIAHLLEIGTYDAVRSKMTTLRDLEKLTRLLIMQRINAMDVGQLEVNLANIAELFMDLIKDKALSAFFVDSCGIRDNIHTLCDTIRSVIGEVLDLDICNGFQHRSEISDQHFIRRGYDSGFDTLVETWMDSYDKLVGVQTWMNQLIKPFEKKGSDLVKIHSTEKMGYQIQSTKRRISILNEQIKKLDKEVKITYFSKYHQAERTFVFGKIGDMDYVNVSKSSSNQYIENPMIKKICHEIVHSKNMMLESQSRIFNGLVKSLLQQTDALEEIVKFVARLDFSTTKAYVAFKNNYHRPTIVDSDSSQSQVSVKGLRHPLIEKLLQKESYVTNDVYLGLGVGVGVGDNEREDQKGILLYGTNAVGKSSFIKALGIAVIMAQAGFYVPAEHMTLTPYLHIFTRILGNDNLFKGLSSFAVEMSEFKTILTMANDRSLILGDELCSGTESSSAISIFLAGIDHLYKKNSSFIFATHFHEITHLPEITDKKALSLKHMSVHYEVAKDKLVYDRKLRDGPGENMYGLEVCKALHLPAAFLEAAHELRNKYNKAGTGVLDYKPSRYNPQKLRGKCEMCHAVFSTEVHHKAQQKDAGINGFIGSSLHKNHLSNLMSLCEACHHKIHNEKELETSCGL